LPERGRRSDCLKRAMWQQLYDPLGNMLLSACVAALPVLFFLLALTVLRLQGLTAALLAVALSAVVSSWTFGMPAAQVAGAALLGFANGLFPSATSC